MPQKKKKTSNHRSKKSKSSFKKGKVQIPAYKIIILCSIIIALCMVLLLITTFGETDNFEAPKSVAERFEPEIQNAKPETDNNKKETSKPASNPKKPAETPKKPSSSNAGTPNSSINKPEIKPPSQASSKPAQKPAENKKTDTQPSQSSKTDTNQAAKPVPSASTTTSNAAQTVPPASSGYNFPVASAGAQLVILFDDGGQNLNQLKKCLELPFPVTIAVLPQLAHSVEAAELVRQSGNELMLHQPMQAINTSVNPGPGAITPDMTEEQIRSTLFNNINQIGPIAGFNNHEGSAITADAEKMETVLKVAESQGIYFLDSRTNVDTKVPYVCRELGYSYYERNGYFLDNEKTKENALKELRRNLDIANKNGVVIMIGHVWSADFLPAFLKDVYPELKSKGYTFTTVSKCKGRKR